MSITLASMKVVVCLQFIALFGPVSAGARSAAKNEVVIFSNFGPKGKSYECCSGYEERGQFTPYGAIAVAFRFSVSGSDYMLTSVRIPLRTFIEEAAGHSFLFAVANDAGNRPGAPLFQRLVTKASGFGVCCETERIRVSVPFKLLKGHSYWLEATPSQFTNGGWATAVGHSKMYISESDDGGHTWGAGLRDNAAAFAVYGTPTN